MGEKSLRQLTQERFQEEVAKELGIALDLPPKAIGERRGWENTARESSPDASVPSER